MINILHVILVIQCFVLTMVSPTYHYIKKPEDSNDHHQIENYIDKANLVFCSEDGCELIRTFKVAANNTFNCLDRYLGIEFEIEMLDKTDNIIQIPVYSYLNNAVTEEMFNILKNEQKRASSCQDIKQ